MGGEFGNVTVLEILRYEPRQRESSCYADACVTQSPLSPSLSLPPSRTHTQRRTDPEAGAVTIQLRDRLQLPVAQTIYSISLTEKACCWTDGRIVRAYGGASNTCAYWTDPPSFEVLCGAMLLSNRSEEQTVCTTSCPPFRFDAFSVFSTFPSI